MTTDSRRIRERIKAFDFVGLFTQELMWNHFPSRALPVLVDGVSYDLMPVAQRGMAVFVCIPPPDVAFPKHTTRRKIDSIVGKTAREHIIIFQDRAKTVQIWQWVRREANKPSVLRSHIFHAGQSGDALVQKIQAIAFGIEDESNVAETVARVSAAFDIEKVTRKFYEDFKAEHDALLGFLSGIPDEELERWYASVMLNRLMFIYFIQKKRFIAGDPDYLSHRLAESKARSRDGFYRDFLCPLFFDGFAKPDDQRTAEMKRLLGAVPYLNGSLFLRHQIEQRFGRNIDIPDKAFDRLFSFFERYDWHLDDRATKTGREINPDVLGYVFEKYINQREMGAYYTKEDVTEYICTSTILPRLLDLAHQNQVGVSAPDKIALLLAENPDRYIWSDVLWGVDLPLPDDVAAGLSDPGARDAWDRTAPPEFGLKKETWAQCLYRREIAAALRASLRANAVTDIDTLVTLNVNIGQIVQDLLELADESSLASWWSAISELTVLDPACGSGAFLFAALKTLQPLYTSILEAMEAVVTDHDLTAHSTEESSVEWMRVILSDIEKHPNSQYFVLKTIALNNVFGVDVMEEATEICKLRLFLKLIAEIDSVEHIEPLPDLDFNVRVGNSLVGLISRADFDRLRELPLDYETIKANIEAQSEIADEQFDVFRKLQTARSIDPAKFAEAKSRLRESLSSLAESCNSWLARQYGKNPGNSRSMAAWLQDYQPFNWFAEFHRVFQRGGFDAVIGNPPYVNRAKVKYEASAFGEPAFPDIYGNFVLRSLRLKHPEGRCGLIVPLSLTFSEDFVELRARLTEQGSNWVSSFDNIPAALFAGVSQRCTIWIHSPFRRQTATTQMYRWRSDYRSHLLKTLSPYVLANAPTAAYGLPKLADKPQERVLDLHMASSARRPDLVFGGRTSPHAIGFGAAARNFISVFTELPPELDATTLKPIEKTKAGFVKLASERSEAAALAALSGDAFFWYWLVRGDGFDVTSWIVRDFLACLGGIDDNAMSILAEIGVALHERRYECLVFKKNGGKYVGNLNYNHLGSLTHAADEVLLCALGATESERVSIYDYVRRLLAINEFAGEKAVPEEVKRKFRAKAVDPTTEQRLISRAKTFVDSEDRTAMSTAAAGK